MNGRITSSADSPAPAPPAAAPSTTSTNEAPPSRGDDFLQGWLSPAVPVPWTRQALSDPRHINGLEFMRLRHNTASGPPGPYISLAVLQRIDIIAMDAQAGRPVSLNAYPFEELCRTLDVTREEMVKCLYVAKLPLSKLRWSVATEQDWAQFLAYCRFNTTMLDLSSNGCLDVDIGPSIDKQRDADIIGSLSPTPDEVGPMAADTMDSDNAMVDVESQAATDNVPMIDDVPDELEAEWGAACAFFQRNPASRAPLRLKGFNVELSPRDMVRLYVALKARSSQDMSHDARVCLDPCEEVMLAGLVRLCWATTDHCTNLDMHGWLGIGCICKCILTRAVVTHFLRGVNVMVAKNKEEVSMLIKHVHHYFTCGTEPRLDMALIELKGTEPIIRIGNRNIIDRGVITADLYIGRGDATTTGPCNEPWPQLRSKGFGVLLKSGARTCGAHPHEAMIVVINLEDLDANSLADYFKCMLSMWRPKTAEERQPGYFTVPMCLAAWNVCLVSPLTEDVAVPALVGDIIKAMSWRDKSHGKGLTYWTRDIEELLHG